MKDNYLDLERSDWVDFGLNENLPAYRAGQIYRWQGRAIETFDEMSDLSKDLRSLMSERFITGFPKVVEHYISENSDSEKWVLALSDGQIIESVLMKHRYGFSACVTTQAGCRMGCQFCASTGIPYARNLTRGEMLAQILFLQKAAGAEISRVDLMGIGEPLENYEEVLAFIRRMQDEEILGLSPRNVALSTCGLVPGIIRLADEALPLTLAISLHAPNQEIRERIMPVAKAYPLPELIRAADLYFEKTGRRISYEYALFFGVNDDPNHAEELADLLHGKNCHVNLIPANDVKGSGLKGSTTERMKRFQSILEKRRIQVSMRRSMGQDIQAACGQLRRSSLLAPPQCEC